MTRLLLSFTLCILGLWAYSQELQERSLHYYIEAANENSPLIKDIRNQSAIQQSELQRLKAIYTRSRLEVNGEYLFVPVISKDGGKTSFKWNAQDGTDYYGYDLGESSGHFHAGLTWTQPVLGNSAYKVAQEQNRIDIQMADNNIRMEKHQLERSVTEHYLLCLLDKIQISFSDSVASLLERQIDVVKRLAASGLAKQSDVNLLRVESHSNEELLAASRQSYRSHLQDLNILCGIDDDTQVNLSETNINSLSVPVYGNSSFVEKYRLDSLSAANSLRMFNQQYKPRLDFFVNGGLQTSDYSNMYRHFGWSAGLTFSWTIYDGKQKKYKEHQVKLQQNSIKNYKDNAEYARGVRIRQCLSELSGFDERESLLNKQRSEYNDILAAYEKELQAGQISVIDYIMVLRNKIQLERDYLLLKTNRQLAVTAYNYWNW